MSTGIRGYVEQSVPVLERIGIVALTGHDGGGMAALADVAVRVPSEVTPLVQQGHLMAGRLLCLLAEEAIHPRG